MFAEPNGDNLPRRSSKAEWQLMIDYTLISNHIPLDTPKAFRNKHLLGFLQLLQPTMTLDLELLDSMYKNSVESDIASGSLKPKLESSYSVSGVPWHHILIGSQKTCVVCGARAMPYASRVSPILVYTSLSEDPQLGSIFHRRCTNRKCQHRIHYSWDVVFTGTAKEPLFKPQLNRHLQPY